MVPFTAVLRKEGRKEMFYLTMHSTHFILRLYGVGRKEMFLFNDALNTFYFTVIWCWREGRKEMFLFKDALNTFYFTVIWRRKEGNVLFNDALNTFYFTVI